MWCWWDPAPGAEGWAGKVFLMSLIWGSSPTSLIQDVAGKPCLLLPSHLQLQAPRPVDEALLPQCEVIRGLTQECLLPPGASSSVQFEGQGGACKCLCSQDQS